MLPSLITLILILLVFRFVLSLCTSALPLSRVTFVAEVRDDVAVFVSLSTSSELGDLGIRHNETSLEARVEPSYTRLVVRPKFRPEVGQLVCRRVTWTKWTEREGEVHEKVLRLERVRFKPYFIVV